MTFDRILKTSIYISEYESPIQKQINDELTSLKYRVYHLMEQNKNKRFILGYIKEEIKRIYDGLNVSAAVEIAAVTEMTTRFSTLAKTKIPASDIRKMKTLGYTHDALYRKLPNGMYNRFRAAMKDYKLGTAEEVQQALHETREHLNGINEKKVQTAIRNEIEQKTNDTQALEMKELKKREPQIRFEFVATLDQRTTVMCQKADGTIFDKIEDFEAAGLMPKLHFNCRSKIVPIVDGPYQIKTRASINGPVDGSITYPEWIHSL